MSDERLKKAEALKKAKEEFLENNKSKATQHFIEGKKSVSLTLKQEDLPELPAVHFRGCSDSTFTIAPGTTVVKVLFEGCSSCQLVLDKCVVSTATLEIWRSDNCTLVVDCFLGTLQADLCKGLKINYTESKHMGSLVQAAMHDLSVSFLDSSFPEYKTGVAELGKEFGEVKDDTEQFISRIVDAKLLTEPIIRLLNDFPTTAREKADFDAQAAKKGEAMEKMAKEMLKDVKGVHSAEGSGEAAGPSKGGEEAAGPSKGGEEDLSDEARKAYKKEQGNASFKAGDFQQAAVWYTEAILLDDKDHSLFSNRAAAFLKLSHAEKALSDAEECVRLKEDFPKGHFRKGVALMALERWQEAGEALGRVLALEPGNKEAAASMQMLQMKAARARSSS